MELIFINCLSSQNLAITNIHVVISPFQVPSSSSSQLCLAGITIQDCNSQVWAAFILFLGAAYSYLESVSLPQIGTVGKPIASWQDLGLKNLTEGFIVLIHGFLLIVTTVLNSLCIYLQNNLRAALLIPAWLFLKVYIKSIYFGIKSILFRHESRLYLHKYWCFQLVENILLSYLFVVMQSILTEKV